MGFRWNDSAVSALKELFATSKSLDAITAEMNSTFGTSHTTNAIYCKLHGLGLKFRGAQIGWKEAETDFMVDLFNDPAGMSYGVIAIRMTEKFGTTFSRSAVIGRAKRLGLRSEDRTVLVINSAVQPDRVPRQAKVSAATEGLRCVEIVPLNLTLADLPDNGCRYIAGDDHLYCGHPRQDKSSYCTPHHHLVWVKPIAKAPKARVYHGTDFARGAA
jgi:GcrA cell cycle regulator